MPLEIRFITAALVLATVCGLIALALLRHRLPRVHLPRVSFGWLKGAFEVLGRWFTAAPSPATASASAEEREDVKRLVGLLSKLLEKDIPDVATANTEVSVAIGISRSTLAQLLFHFRGLAEYVSFAGKGLFAPGWVEYLAGDIAAARMTIKSLGKENLMQEEMERIADLRANSLKEKILKLVDDQLAMAKADRTLDLDKVKGMIALAVNEALANERAVNMKDMREDHKNVLDRIASARGGQPRNNRGGNNQPGNNGQQQATA